MFEKDAKDDDDPSKRTILISITVPDEMLNEKADELGNIETSLTYTFTNIFVKANFRQDMCKFFNKFDGDEKLTIIEEFLGEQIDFEYYLMTGIIDEHFPLHKKDEIKEIQRCF